MFKQQIVPIVLTTISVVIIYLALQLDLSAAYDCRGPVCSRDHFPYF